MRYPDWRLISSFGYVFGALAILVGLYVYLYYETNVIGWIGLAFEPYRNYAIPLIIVGIALLITGYLTEQRARKKIVGYFGWGWPAYPELHNRTTRKKENRKRQKQSLSKI
ncbi:MAG: hypothetical protein ABSD92_11715 [Candidatus Bathyarchaeia archaeon]|jgi:hypothetical protein